MGFNLAFKGLNHCSLDMKHPCWSDRHNIYQSSSIKT